MENSPLSQAELAALAKNIELTRLLLQFTSELNCSRMDAAVALLTAGTVLIEQDCRPEERLIRLNNCLAPTIIAWAQPTPGTTVQ